MFTDDLDSIFDNLDEQKCGHCKIITNKNDTTNLLYKNKYSHANHIGYYTDLYRLLKPKDSYDFLVKQLKYAEDNKNKLPRTKRGPTRQEWIEEAIEWKKDSEAQDPSLNFDADVYLYALLCHGVVETCIGQEKEALFEKLMTIRGFGNKKLEGKMDAREHVDFVSYNIVEDSYIQIKPITFLKGLAPHLIEARAEHVITSKKHWRVDKVPYYFAFYDKTYKTDDLTLYADEKGNFLFTEEQLFSYDENDIFGTIKVKYMPPKKITFF